MEAKMDSIIVFPCQNGDTRSARKDITKEAVHEDVKNHIMNVDIGMNMVAYHLKRRGQEHDETKLTYFEEFWEAFEDAVKNGSNFTESDWYDFHIKTERHHVTSHCPEDVNLFDIIEMLVDCNVAAAERTGTLFTIPLSNDVLQRAYANTSDFIASHIKVIK